MIDVALLGTGGMMPLPRRWLASAMIRIGGSVTLIDCGEGTQIAAELHGFGFHEIDTIVLTHNHADHIAGLPGILFRIGFAVRTDPVLVVGPAGIEPMVRGLASVIPGLPFEVRLAELVGGERFVVGGAEIACLPGDHRVPCLAYRVDLPRAPAFRREQAEALKIPRRLWKRLQQGESVTWDGGKASPEQVLGPARPGLRVGYVTDSRPTEAMPAFFEGADLLISEATFGDPEHAERAIERKHMLFREAAALARDANARELWLTHFSPMLIEPEMWAKQATELFPNTVVGRDGLRTTLKFDA